MDVAVLFYHTIYSTVILVVLLLLFVSCANEDVIIADGCTLFMEEVEDDNNLTDCCSDVVVSWLNAASCSELCVAALAKTTLAAVASVTVSE